MGMLSLLYTLGILGIGVYSYSKYNSPNNEQTDENLSKGTSVAGLQGSGKTVFAAIDAKKKMRQGKYWCWITTQGERQTGGSLGGLIDLLVPDCKKDIILWSPYRKGSRGFNFLKCYSKDARKRAKEMRSRADAVVYLMDNMSERLSDQIKNAMWVASMAVLRYAEVTGIETTMYDALKYTDNLKFRNHILERINDADIEDRTNKILDVSWKSASIRMDYLLRDEDFINAICYTKPDAYNFEDMFDKYLICDFIEDPNEGLGILQARALAQAVMIMFNFIVGMRRSTSELYTIYCDEFYRYAERIENIFIDFPNLHRQRRVPLTLIWQGMKRGMNDDLVNVALACVNQYFMMLSADDVKKICQSERYKPYEEKMLKLKPREYIAFLNVGKKMKMVTGRTEDIYVEDKNLYNFVVRNSKSEYKGGFDWWYRNVDNVQYNNPLNTMDNGSDTVKSVVEGDKF